MNRERAESSRRTVRQQGVDCAHVVHHVAVTNGACAAGIVSGHATKRGAVGGGYIHRVPQTVSFQLPVQLIEYQAGLDYSGPFFGIPINKLVEIFAGVYDQRLVHSLAVLRGAASAGQHWDAGFSGDLQGHTHVVLGFGHHHAERHDLVDRGVGGIASAAEKIEEDVALDFLNQAGGQRVWIGFAHRARLL